VLALLVIGSSGRSAVTGDVVTTVAGSALAAGHRDGSGRAARFDTPAGLATDVDGSILIADSANHCLRRLRADGTVTTVIGRPGQPGFSDGAATSARLDTPSAVAVGPDGTIYLSDTGNHLIRKFAAGRLQTLAGIAGEAGVTNGPGAAARFHSPLGLLALADGSLVVADAGNHSLRRITQTPSVTVATLAGINGDWGSQDGLAAGARFEGPVSLALDPAAPAGSGGRIIVADSWNHTLRRVTLADGGVTTWIGRAGEAGAQDGSAREARLGLPAEIAYDSHGQLLVVDALNHVLRQITPDGDVRTVSGAPGDAGMTDGENGRGRYFNPYGLTLRRDGVWMVSDAYNATVRELLPPFRVEIHRDPQTRAVSVRWDSILGKSYQLFTGRLGDPDWRLEGAPSRANAPVTEQTLDADPDPDRLIRVLRQTPQY